MKLNRASIVLASAAVLAIGVGGIAQAEDPATEQPSTGTSTSAAETPVEDPVTDPVTPDPATPPAEPAPTTCDDFEGEVPSSDPDYHEGLDPDGDDVGCELDESPPATDPTTPTTTVDPTTTEPVPTTTTDAPSETTNNHNEQSQTVVVVPPVERDPANRAPLQSVPSGPIFQP